MTNLLQQAMSLRKSQNYQQAVDIYTPLWHENQNQFDDWAGWSYAFCLVKLNQHKEALEICRMLYPRYPQSEILNSLYGQCIYYTQFAIKNPPPVEVLQKALNAMFKLSPPNNPYSFTPRATFKLIKTLLHQQQINWQEIEAWLLKLDPDMLDDRPFTWTDAKGKTMELASPKEEWYSHMIRAKGGLNKPQELLDILNTARKQNFKWHYNNDIWFERKEAFAYSQLGQKEKAEKILRKIYVQKKEWFILYDLSQVVEDRKEKLRLLCDAALAPGKNEMKLKVYEAFFEYLKEGSQFQREAALHLCLLAALREENGWPVSPVLLQNIRSFNMNAEEEGASGKIINALNPFWKRHASSKPKERGEGVIDVIFPNNQAGFLIYKKQKLFFSAGSMSGKIKKGNKVSFEIKDSFDKKKNRMSKMAVNIQFLS